MTSQLEVTPAGNPPKLMVGIGASAGGLRACKRFLAAMPPDSGMAFVVVMHLAPAQESHIVEIFRGATKMTVAQVSEGLELAANCVYVIAPNTALQIRAGRLETSKPSEPHGARKPIDEFFSSLAEEWHEKAIAIVLSGAGDDGALGLLDVQAQGGLCLVQDTETAEFDGMPLSAVASGAADEILEPEEMPRVIVDYAANPGTKRPRKPMESGGEPLGAFDSILELLGRLYGVNFRSFYKRGTLQRRTERRMSLKQVSNWKTYLEILQADPRELAALYDDLLIGVTQFFRDPEVWDLVQKEVVPNLLERHERGVPVKIWVPGCATGEEPYTLAMIFLEQLEHLARAPKVQIFATDIDEGALAFARRGLYPETIRDAVSADRLSRFFRKEGEGYQISRRVRETVTFAVHNLLADPPFSRLDLVSCRNLLIYLESDAQRRLLKVFHYALNPGGTLVLGSSESVGQNRNLFETVSEKARVFRALAHEGPRFYPLSWIPEQPPYRGVARPPAPVAAPKGPRVSRAIEQLVLGRHTQACVAVTESFEIQSFFGPTSEYLVQPTGEARMDLLTWARPGIYPQLRVALDKARETNQPVTASNLRLERDSETALVECTVEPIVPLPGQARMFLVAFRDIPQEPPIAREGAAASDEPIVRQLEAELKDTQLQLRGTIEQLESVEDGYRTSHEELLSLNEELQSNNEELEASKEELQSLNEELVTINRQLEEKNIELRDVSTDLNNLLVSADIPIIFLDKGLRVRRFTPAATVLMRLVPSDVGRSVEHIKERFHDEHLIGDAKKVLESLVSVSAEVESEDGRFYTREVLPYRTDADRVDGVCVAFHDITERRRASQESESARHYAEAIVATVQTAVLVLDSDMRVLTANDSFCEEFQVLKSDVERASLFGLGNREWDIPALRELLEKILPEKEEVWGFEVEHEFEKIGRRVMIFNARRMRLVEQPLIVVAINDITGERDAERRATATAADLAREHQRKDEFLAMLGHELRNPLAALMYGLDLLGQQWEEPGRLEEIRGMMVRQSRRVLDMLDQLLDLARLNAGKVQMARVPVDLAKAARAAIEAATPLIHKHQHELVVSIPPQDSVYVEGDPSRLTQVIENLLANAAKYTEDRGTIWLSLTENQRSAFIRVRDTGIGMDAELVPHIFEQFFQAPRTMDRAAGGMGLGLPIVKTVVELHGGTVVATSPGRGMGSELIVTLPRLQKTSENERAAEEAKAVVAPARAHRILVVDDERDTALALARLLAKRGHDARAIHESKAALELARTFQPDIVLLDLGLPQMDGYALAEQLRKEYAGRKVLLVALTGYQKDVERLTRAGFDHHMIKPADIDELLGIIEAWP